MRIALTLMLAVALATPAAAQLAPVPFPNEDCYQPAGNPEPGSAEWDDTCADMTAGCATRTRGRGKGRGRADAPR
jgi:hypothetical protein